MNNENNDTQSKPGENEPDIARMLYGDFGNLIDLILGEGDYPERLVRLILYFQNAPESEVGFICEAAMMFIFMKTDEYKHALQAWLAGFSAKGEQ
jgi:hypothetical protein